MSSQALGNPFDESGSLSASRAKRGTALTKRKKKGRLLPLAAILIVLLASAGGGAFLYMEWQNAVRDNAGIAEERDEAMERAAKAESAAVAAEAKLARAEEQLESNQARLAKAEKEAEAKEAAAGELESKLSALLEEGQGQVTRGADGRLTLELVDKVLFASGEAELTKRGQKVMARVGAALAEMQDKQVWVQGHTDNVPIKKNNEFFATNWELSAARALTVVHYLQDQSLVDPKRLAAAAFGSHRPVSKRNRKKNRRIEIVLFPRKMRLKR